MGKTKHSRSRSKDKESEELRKRLKRLEKKLEERDEDNRRKTRRSPSPGTPPLSLRNNNEVEDLAGDEISEDLLLALGKEGEESEVLGDELQPHLVKRWTNIIQQGLDKEAKENLIKKYPKPKNFPLVVPPKINPEIQASLSEVTIKRDRRIVTRQAMLGKVMTALGKTLSNIMKGNLNSKEMVETLNDAAKLTGEVYHQDSVSRKYFALAGTSSVVREAVKNEQPDDFLFGKACAEKIKAAQAIQRQSNIIRKTGQENWKSPLQGPTQYRSGQSYRQPVKAAGRPAQPAQRSQPVQRAQPAPRIQPGRKKTTQSQKPNQSRYCRRY